jgi:hypothetical protein
LAKIWSHKNDATTRQRCLQIRFNPFALLHYTIIIMTTLPAEVQRTLPSGNGKGGGGGGITESVSQWRSMPNAILPR